MEIKTRAVALIQSVQDNDLSNPILYCGPRFIQPVDIAPLSRIILTSANYELQTRRVEAKDRKAALELNPFALDKRSETPDGSATLAGSTAVPQFRAVGQCADSIGSDFHALQQGALESPWKNPFGDWSEDPE
jgi:hypothetical protein